MTPAHIGYESGVLRLLDQRKLPLSVEYVELRDWQAVARAINAMIVRGAPAIGIAGAYGMALAARAGAPLAQAAAGLSAARPTAVNLSWAVGRVRAEVERKAEQGADAESLVVEAERAARAIHDEDIAACKRIGDAGAALIPAGATVLTHCNTGSLATGGYGTALGVIRSAWRDRRIPRVLVGETRPLLQGARLTAWELGQDGIPHALVTDSMAAYFMGRGDVGAVVVGADRIARNGDVANKIGTYGLAVLARAHDIPFIVAAPLSTLDAQTPTGDSIVIEERDPREVTSVLGTAIAPAGTTAANPAFDVTPARLVTAIVTERGVMAPPFESKILASLHVGEAPSGAVVR